MKTQITFVRSDEVNDIFSYIDESGEIEYTKFPRTMEMTVTEVEDYLN
jgi:hypothetical protein